MSENHIITTADLLNEPVRRALSGVAAREVLWLLSGNRGTAGERSNARLLVTDARPEQFSALINDSEVPTTTPLLFLGSSPPTTTTAPEISGRITDYLSLPAEAGLLQHRLALLLRIQLLAAENQGHAQSVSRQLDALFNRDGLTGLYNRRQLTIRLGELFQNACNDNRDLSVLLLNIDYFSSINKALGLAFGDLILNEMAARLTSMVHEGASCYRFSGEEFVVVLPGADTATATATATEICRNCAGKPFSDGNESRQVTISIGTASLCAHQPESHERLLGMAQAALFSAKAGGRNRVCSYQPRSPKDTTQHSHRSLRESLHRILDKTRQSVIDSLELLARNTAGPEHQTHIDTVSSYINLLGEHLGLSEHHLQTFQNSITLYHSFRLLLHNDLSGKPGELTADEKQGIAELPLKISEITDMFHYFSEENQLLQCHAERYDGTGKPFGLRGDEIPLGARIFNLANSLAAMVGSRPYRRPLTAMEIITELKNQAGRQFDPDLVIRLLEVIENKKLLPLDPEALQASRAEVHNSFPVVSP